MHRITLPRVTSLRPRPAHFTSSAYTLVKRPSAPGQTFSWQDTLRQKLWGPSPPGSPTPYETPTPPPEEPPSTSGYIEAIDARGLRIVGLEEPLQEWDVPVFKTNHKFTSNTSLLRAVHRATIEVYTATLNNHPFTTLYTGPESLTETVSISISPSSAATFSYPPSTEAAILSLLSFDTTDPANNHVYTEDELFPPDSPLPEWVEHTAWTALPLNEEGVRFEVVRRVLQLTGVKVPDAEATKMKTVAQMLECLQQKPKPKKLFETLVESELRTLPNVKVFGSRVRPWDRERAVGREREIEKVVEFRYPFEKAGR